jgi:hypothetical protein
MTPDGTNVLILPAICPCIVSGGGSVMAKDYYPLVRRAVSQLESDSDRERLYERLRQAQIAELEKLGFSGAEFSKECRALSTAISNVESETKNLLRLRKKGSTELLSFSLLFPGLWMLDPTPMAVYWVARFPKRL